MPERLRHVGRDRADALGHLARHHLVEGEAVGGGQRVGVLPVDLELRRPVLVVRRVGLPAEAVQVGDERAEIAHRAGEALEVVAGLLEGVDAVRIERLDAAVRAPPHQEVLRLRADHHHEPLAEQLGGHAAERGPRAVGPGLAVHRDVAREAGHTRLPRDQRVGREIGHRDHVVIVRALSHPRHRRAGEAGGALEEEIERPGGDALAAGRAVDVHELGEEVVDLVLLDLRADLVRRHRGLLRR